MTGDRALLVMDVQQEIVGRFVDDADYLPRLAGTIGAARSHGIPVIYVVIGFRAGHPDISDHNRSFSRMRATQRYVPSDPSAEVAPDVAPAEGDLVVIKKRVSAFAGSDLELLLRSLRVRDLVLAGIATSGVVLSTVRQAADLDYGLTVLADGCLDADPEVHRVLLDKIFPRQAEVVTSKQWQDGLG